MAKSCESCKLRSKYDRKPTSLLGRLWRWHIRWCPGWKQYMASLQPPEREKIVKDYRLQ